MDHLAQQVGLQASIDLTADNAQLDAALFRDRVKPADRERRESADAYEARLAMRDEMVRAALAQLALDPKTAATLFDWLRVRLRPEQRQATLARYHWTARQAATVLRVLQYTRLASSPIQTELHGTTYEWAGRTLQRLFGTPERYSETWAFFSDRVGMGPAQIRNTTITVGDVTLKPITMRDVAMRLPSVLGPEGCDPQNANQKYFFVKHLDPSDFPDFAYVGFNPQTVGALDKTPEAFKAYVADFLWRDRQAVERFYELVRSGITSKERCDALKAAYKAWAIEQAKADWQGDIRAEWLGDFVAPKQRAAAGQWLIAQQTVRRALISLMHKIHYEDDHAILIESPTLHGMMGLSLQSHPKHAGNFSPKDELWIHKHVSLPDGTTGWVLVEPQRTFDTTESGADFFTPFTWTDEKGFGFRKPITRPSLDAFVELIDLEPKPKAHYLHTAQSVTDLPAGWSMGGAARWYRTVDEPVWPHFIVHELRFRGSGEAVRPLEHHSFIELHVTQGEVTLTLTDPKNLDPLTVTVTPTQPVFLPASLPYQRMAFKAGEPAQLLFFTRPRPDAAVLIRRRGRS